MAFVWRVEQRIDASTEVTQDVLKEDGVRVDKVAPVREGVADPSAGEKGGEEGAFAEGRGGICEGAFADLEGKAAVWRWGGGRRGHGG